MVKVDQDHMKLEYRNPLKGSSAAADDEARKLIGSIDDKIEVLREDIKDLEVMKQSVTRTLPESYKPNIPIIVTFLFIVGLIMLVFLGPNLNTEPLIALWALYIFTVIMSIPIVNEFYDRPTEDEIVQTRQNTKNLLLEY